MLPSAGREVRGLIPAMKIAFFASLVLTLVGFVDLYVLADRANYSPWTIKPPLSAAFLGAGYGAGFVLFLLGSRDRTWARTRIAILTVWEFTVFTLLATLLNLGKFHLDVGTPIERVAAWLWLTVYVAFPIGVGVFIVIQERMPGIDPPLTRPVPRPLIAALATQGTVMLATGIALFVAPTRMGRSWPWPLTPLTARTIGAWFLALGIAAFHAILERDLPRLRPAAITYSVFAVLQLSAILRFHDDVRWDKGWTIVYLIWLGSVAVVGACGAFVARPGVATTVDLTTEEPRRAVPDRRIRARAPR